MHRKVHVRFGGGVTVAHLSKTMCTFVLHGKPHVSYPTFTKDRTNYGEISLTWCPKSASLRAM